MARKVYKKASTNEDETSENGDDEETMLEDESDSDFEEEDSVKDPPPVRVLLLSFMFMFMGYGAMVGVPQHALKHKLDLSPEQAGDFQDATASFQLAKLLMRILQIAFLVFMQPNGIVYLSYAIMFVAVLVPVVLVWGMGVTELWVVYLQYILGGIAVGFFEGTFLSVISTLGKNTKTFAIMGAPLGFAVHNILLGTFSQMGMPVLVYYLSTAACLPVGALIFHNHAPSADPNNKGKGCNVFMYSMRKSRQWMPKMLPWFFAKFVGNFVLEDGFPLLFNTFNTAYVPMFGGPASTSYLMPFAYYTAWIWFPAMAVGDTISRRVPQFIPLRSWRSITLCLVSAIFACFVGEAMNFLLLPIVSAFAVFISNFGNGFIYGLSAKYIDLYIPEQHRYAAYNLWCFCGDLGGYAGQSSMSVKLAEQACAGRHYQYVCHVKGPRTTTFEPFPDATGE
eukprot:TRINITY_DN75295_c0_g1_i1.p1 TRINITY_DN75295_c0_g1~~TRINITY_DN75295_c0_g1_i1.p1  ORF type:complete len:451 (+),score=70.85 TRINITY_DN75295_c0_g1_i1:50-1402(+)